MRKLLRGFGRFFKDIFRDSESQSTLRQVRSFRLFALVVLIILDIFLIYVILGKSVPQFYFPQDVYISNLTPNSATVSWNTKLPIESIVLLSTNGTFPLLPNLHKERFFDDKDRFFKEPNKYRLHHTTVSNLTPGTTYRFGIYVGLKRLRTVRFTTPEQGLTQSEPIILTGKVLHTDGQTQAAGLNVYYRVRSASASSSLLSTVTDPEGIWLFDASKFYTRDLSSKLEVLDNMDQIVTIDASPLGKYEVATSSASLKQWPTVTIKDKR